MFYVGAYTTFAGAKPGNNTEVKTLEKLGHSRGRAERFLDQHPRMDVGGKSYRAVIFQLPNGFILRNDMIRLAMEKYECDWSTAKFQIYREASQDVLARRKDWPEIEPAPVEQSTAGPDGNATDAEVIAPVVEGAPVEHVPA